MLITISVYSTKRVYGTAKPFGGFSTLLLEVMSTMSIFGMVQTVITTGVTTIQQKHPSEDSKWPMVQNSNGINTPQVIWIFVLQLLPNWLQIRSAILM